MCKIVTMYNNKGGVSKTTTLFNLGVFLAQQGNRVLIVDCDPQCNMTEFFFASYPNVDEPDVELPGTSIYQALLLDMRYGVSILQPVLSALLEDEAIAASVAHLVQETSIPIVQVPGLREALSAAGPVDFDTVDASHYMSMLNANKGIYRTLLLDQDEDFKRVDVSWSGLPDLMDRMASRLAAAADIPATRFEGRSPVGMNATGDSDMDNYVLMLEAERNRQWGTGRLSGICRVFANRQLGFVVTDFIEHIGGVANRDGAEFGAVLRELIRTPTIKGNAHPIAQRRRKQASMAILTGHRKALAIGGGGDVAAGYMASITSTWRKRTAGKACVPCDSRGEQASVKNFSVSP